ncbi:MAG: SDR family oxidoreductase, partial [Steroidobacteraceae bacterium]
MSSTAASMLSSKTCVVTGATSGIGEATAQGLAALGATVVVHGRDASKGRRTLERIERATGSRSVRFLQADLASLAQVRRLAGEIRSSLPRLDILVHNAGLACAHRSLTTDGYERTFAVNHLAPFLLTQLLAAPLAQSPAGRIVVVSSEAHRGAQLDFEDLMLARRYGQIRAYARSKLANLLFTRALARRLTGTAVTCNALHPGVVRTGIFREAPAFLRGILGSIGRVLLLPPEKGARTSLYLATSDEAAGRSGGYYISCKRTQPSEA